MLPALVYFLKRQSLSQVAHTRNPSTWPAKQVSPRLAWVTQQDPGQAGFQRELLSQKTKLKKKITFTLHWQFEIKTGHGAAGLGSHAAAHGVPELPS